MARQLKRLTIEVPADLLERTTAASGEGVTPTVRRGLELVAAGGPTVDCESFEVK